MFLHVEGDRRRRELLPVALATMLLTIEQMDTVTAEGRWSGLATATSNATVAGFADADATVSQLSSANVMVVIGEQASAVSSTSTAMSSIVVGPPP